jgi:hypothetical protein
MSALGKLKSIHTMEDGTQLESCDWSQVEFVTTLTGDIYKAQFFLNCFNKPYISYNGKGWSLSNAEFMGLKPYCKVKTEDNNDPS